MVAVVKNAPVVLPEEEDALWTSSVIVTILPLLCKERFLLRRKNVLS